MIARFPTYDKDLCASQLQNFKPVLWGCPQTMQIASGPTEQPLHRSVVVEYNYVCILYLIYRNIRLNERFVLLDAPLYRTAKQCRSGACVCVCVFVCVCEKSHGFTALTELYCHI
jgi:hypothetical protein